MRRLRRRSSASMIRHREFTLENLLALPTFCFPTVSPDGARIAYFSSTLGGEEVCVLDIGGGHSQVLLPVGIAPTTLRTPIVWARDGQALYYSHDIDGSEQYIVWRVAIEGGRHQLSADRALHEAVVEESHNGSFRCFISSRQHAHSCAGLAVPLPLSVPRPGIGCLFFRFAHATSPAQHVKKEPSHRPRPPSGPPRSLETAAARF